MSEKPYKLLMLGFVIIVFLFALQPYQFQQAWSTHYTYASSITSSASVPANLNVANDVLTSDSTFVIAQEPKQPTVITNNEMLPKTNPLSKRVVEYHIQVNYNENEHLLEGEQIINWKNPGKKPVTEFYLHLYPNAFESENSTFMSESGGKLRSDIATANSLGYMQITGLETLKEDNLLPRMKMIAPDDGNEHDHTVATFRLIEPLAAGEELNLRVRFTVKLPEVFARMGYSGDFVMAGQWFPKVAAYETEGTRGNPEGWNVHQYHGNSEFYSNFGVYNVKIHVPEHYVVAGSGIHTKTTPLEDGRKMVSYYAEDVHDFAFALSPEFITKESSFSTSGIPGTKIKLYVDPTHEHLTDRYIHAAKSALAYFGKYYGTYPYSTLSIVVPPKGASGAGGMEYPTLVTALAADNENPGYELERTVIHEIGHQYFYGIIANNEFEEAWLDEGFTSYIEEKVMDNAYGVKSNHRVESIYMTNPAPLKLNAWLYDNHQHYGENVYWRAKLLLLDIESIIGTQLMNKVMRSYFNTYQFKHPSSEQFQALLEKVTGQSWQAYFDAYVYDRRSNDLAIVDIQTRKFNEMNKDLYEYTILLEQNSAINRTIPIDLVFEDGSIVRKAWEIGKDSNVHFIERSEVPLKWIWLDPQQQNKLDHRLNNNFMRAQLPEQEHKASTIISSTILDMLLRLFSW